MFEKKGKSFKKSKDNNFSSGEVNIPELPKEEKPEEVKRAMKSLFGKKKERIAGCGCF